MSFDWESYARLGRLLKAKERRERSLWDAIGTGDPADTPPKGRALLHVRCAACGSLVVTAEDHDGLLCYRAGPKVWPLFPPPLVCATHGELDIDPHDLAPDLAGQEAARTIRVSPR